MENSINPFKNADICTHCGYCHSVCPTYRLDNDETESPRGRIAIILALASGNLTPEEAAKPLSRCLLCRACHDVCPAGVRPAKLTLLVRNLVPVKPLGISRILHAITCRPRLTSWAAKCLTLYQAFWQQRVRRSNLLARIPPLAYLESLLPEPRPNEPIPPLVPQKNRATHPNPVRVGLLCGCMARLFYPAIGPSVINLLTLTGVEVAPLPGFGCCGAPFRESGDRQKFLRQARRTLDAFMAAGAIDFVLSDSAICQVTIKSYARSLANDPRYAAPAKEFTDKIVDFNSFLLQRMENQAIIFGNPGLGDLLYHDHCQTRYGLGIMEEPRKLLDKLPVKRHESVIKPGVTHGCCGAGGEYMLHHPQRSQAIRAAKLDTLTASGAQCIVASNPGCMMHLETGLRQSGSLMQVRHLAEILWRAYLNNL